MRQRVAGTNSPRPCCHYGCSYQHMHTEQRRRACTSRSRARSYTYGCVASIDSGEMDVAGGVPLGPPSFRPHARPHVSTRVRTRGPLR